MNPHDTFTREMAKGYLKAFEEGDFVKLNYLAERAGYNTSINLQEVFGEKTSSLSVFLMHMGLPSYLTSPISADAPHMKYDGILREKSGLDGNGKQYVIGGPRKENKPLLIKGAIKPEKHFGQRLMEDVNWDPDLSAPVHDRWRSGDHPFIATLGISLIGLRRGFQKAFNPDHTKYNKDAVLELVSEAGDRIL